MRLLNVDTFKLQTFYRDIPPYAILSHTWGEEHEEVQFADIQDLNRAKQVSGFNKLTGCANVAKQWGLQWIWSDTCCINKQDAVEFNEALISMYRWYAQAQICVALLSDVTNESELERARWFTRGWTLQELLAPTNVHFYSKDFQYLIGTRNEMANKISVITTIPIEILCAKKSYVLPPPLLPPSSPLYEEPEKPSKRRSLAGLAGAAATGVAMMTTAMQSPSTGYQLFKTMRSIDRDFERLSRPLTRPEMIERIFSWSSRRQTKREEDEIYCLIGLFGVSMPALYGEGRQRARKRLTKELRDEELSSTDPSMHDYGAPQLPLYAQSPDYNTGQGYGASYGSDHGVYGQGYPQDYSQDYGAPSAPRQDNYLSGHPSYSPHY